MRIREPSMLFILGVLVTPPVTAAQAIIETAPEPR
jgi:hypothetical protein